MGGLMDLVTRNPQILAAVAGLLSTRDTTIGGSGGRTCSEKRFP
jgi:hypothetical protein